MGNATDITIRAKYADMGVKKGMTGLLSAVGRIKGMLATVAIAGTALAAGLGVSLGAQVEKNLITVATVAGATAQELAGITAEARKIGATTAYTAGQAAEGMINLARAGMRPQQIIAATADTMKLAGATASDMTTATKAVAATLSQFGLKASSAQRVVDAFAYSTSRCLFDLPALAEAMKFAGTTAKGLGMDLEDAVTAVSMFANLGLEGSMSGMAFRMAMIQLAGGTDQVREALRRVGLVYEDVNPSTHSYIDLIDNLTKGHWDAAAAVDVFGTRAGLNMLQIINQVKKGELSLDDFREGILEAQKGTGLAAQMYGRMMDNVSGDWAILKSTMQEAMLTGFDYYKGTLRKMMQATTEFVRQGTEQFAFLAKNSGAIMASLKNFIVMTFSDWDFFTGLLAGIWMEFSWLFPRIINSLGYLFLNIMNMVGRVAKIIWTPLGTMFVFLLNTLLYKAKGWINSLLELIETGINKIPGIEVELPKLDLGLAPTMNEYWKASWESMKQEWDKIKAYNDDTISLIKQAWAGFGEYTKAAVQPAMAAMEGLNREIDKIVGETPVTGIVDPEEAPAIRDVAKEIEDLLARAQSIGSLSDLVGKGILGKEFEAEIIREKIAVIGELKDKILELQSLPMNTERLGQIAELASAYKDLTEQVKLSFEEQFAAAQGFKAKMAVVMGEIGKEQQSAAETFRNIVREILEGFASSFTGFFHDLVADSKNSTRNFAANIIQMVGQIAQMLGMLIFLAGCGLMSLGWIHAGPGAIAAGLGLMALGGLAQGVATKMRRQNEAQVTAEQERQEELRQGVARNVQTEKKTEITVKIQDETGSLSLKGKREAQDIVTRTLREMQDQGVLKEAII